MKKLIISVLGQDRPGIIAAISEVLYKLDFNIQDVSQTILQSSFSSIFIVSGPDSADPEVLTAALQKATDKMNMHCYVKQLEENQPKWTEGDAWRDELELD